MLVRAYSGQRRRQQTIKNLKTRSNGQKRPGDLGVRHQLTRWGAVVVAVSEDFPGCDAPQAARYELHTPMKGARGLNRGFISCQHKNARSRFADLQFTLHVAG